jgi:hypothetical protein
MEPLNLMVSLSHFANDKRENEHGLSERVGRGRHEKKRGRRFALNRNAERIWRTRARVLP